MFSAVAGDITQKGYEKKRTRLLQQYASKQIGKCFAFLEFIKILASKQREISSHYSQYTVRSGKVSEVKILSPYIFSHTIYFALSITFFKARYVDKDFNILLKTLLFNFLDEVLLIIDCNIWSTRKKCKSFYFTIRWYLSLSSQCCIIGTKWVCNINHVLILKKHVLHCIHNSKCNLYKRKGQDAIFAACVTLTFCIL